MCFKSTIISLLFLIAHTSLSAAPICGQSGVWLQVLGSGGPEVDDGRASSGYVIWQAGRARLLIDMGGGSLAQFEQSGASLNDLDAILLTHLHVDHTNDLPALIKASFFTGRDRDLPIYGPTGNQRMPSTTEFVQRLFGTDGAFRYLQDYLDGTGRYQLLAEDVASEDGKITLVMDKEKFKLSAISVHHGPIPAIAWRVDIADTSLVFSGDMSNNRDVLWRLAAQTDMLIAHHAIPEQTNPVARSLHMPPSEIGKIAARAKVKRVVLSHRMRRTFGKEYESRSIIRKHYRGPVVFADDLQCFAIKVDEFALKP